jgi:large conductance mechanosensitive channel
MKIKIKRPPNPLKLSVVDEFKAFLLKHGVIGMAVGVVIGAAVGKVVKALVDNFIMPIVGLLTPTGEWRALKVGIFGVGDFAGNVLDFIIVSFVVFMIIKNLIKEAPPPPTKMCPKCCEGVPVQATRCKFCTSEIAA